jgi:DNA-binding transcriptional regulator YiaG
MTHHYTDSGLDNVYLENGYTIHQTPYGEGVSIENVEGLHRAIGQWLVSLPKPLNGAECRFLRLEMSMSQRDLAGSLGLEEQAVRRWEKNRDGHFNGAADRLLRILYVAYCDENSIVRELVERLNQLDQIEHADACFTDSGAGWRLAA